MEIGELEKTAAQYSDIIYRVALQYTAHPCDAEDVLQEVLMELFRKSEVFESPDHERRWLLRVTINKSKNLLRRGKRHHTLSIEELPETAAPPETSYRELYEAVLSLPRNQRLTVDLYYYEGYTTEEIAALMDARPASYVACCGTSAIPVITCLDRMARPEEVVLCLDNDEAGHKACRRMEKQLTEKYNVTIRREISAEKDWNDDLCAMSQDRSPEMMMGAMSR